MANTIIDSTRAMLGNNNHGSLRYFKPKLIVLVRLNCLKLCVVKLNKYWGKNCVFQKKIKYSSKLLRHQISCVLRSWHPWDLERFWTFYYLQSYHLTELQSVFRHYGNSNTALQSVNYLLTNTFSKHENNVISL